MTNRAKVFAANKSMSREALGALVAECFALNRTLLAQLRRVERKTRLRAEWTHAGLTERFFHYVPKGNGPAVP